MNSIPSTTELLAKYQEQNSEIIRSNIRLNERIAILESIISQLQQENLQLRINNVRKTRNKQSNKVIKIPTRAKMNKARQNPPKTDDTPTTPIPNMNSTSNSESDIPDNNNNSITSHKRSCNSKPINYSLPSTKSKLRKGDPFTFGNEKY